MFTDKQIKSILDEYEEGSSTYVLAEKYETYPQKIRRLLKKHGKPLRGKSEAQSNAIKTGAHPHPTAGTERDEETKLKISSGMVDYFDGLTEEEREEISQRGRDRWNQMTPEERASFRDKGNKAVRLSRDQGSKLEKIVRDRLTDLGFTVKFHDDNIITGRDLQVDLSIPSKMVAIEVDGPSHFLPIWGEDKLRKQEKFDHDKNALLQHYGFTVIRVRHENDNLAKSKIHNLIQNLEVEINDTKKGRLVKLEL